MNIFPELKIELDNYADSAWEKLKINIALVVKHWCKAEYFETEWMVNEAKIVHENDFFTLVYDSFRSNYETYKTKISDYADLKAKIISIAEGLLQKGFGLFYQNICKNDEQAWKILNYRLQIIIKSWLQQKGETSQASFETIYYDSLSVFIENVRKGLLFENSKKLKSYFLKIADNKRKEYYRLNNSSKFESFDIQKIDLPFEIDLSIEIKQKKEQLKRSLDQLNSTEKTILYGVYFYSMKLKDIAILLDIKEEACRVTKLRALRKLQDLYSQ